MPISLTSDDIAPAAQGLWAIESALSDPSTSSDDKVVAALAAAHSLHTYVGGLLTAKGGVLLGPNDTAKAYNDAIVAGKTVVYSDSVPGGGGKGTGS